MTDTEKPNAIEKQSDGHLPEPAPSEFRLETVLHALADPTRLRIVTALAAGQHELSCQAFALPVTKSTGTHHFKVLREAGVIRQHRRGTARMSELREAEMEERFPGLLSSVLNAAKVSAPRAAD